MRMCSGLLKHGFRYKDFWIITDWSTGVSQHIIGLQAVIPHWLETPDIQEFPAKPWKPVATFKFTGKTESLDGDSYYEITSEINELAQELLFEINTRASWAYWEAYEARKFT